MTPQQLITKAQRFVREHTRGVGGRRRSSPRGTFAAMSGQDVRAWAAFVLLVELWTSADLTGRAAAVDAMTACLATAQRNHDVHWTFALAIAAVGEWRHITELWPRIGGLPGAQPASTSPFRTLSMSTANDAADGEAVRS